MTGRGQAHRRAAQPADRPARPMALRNGQRAGSQIVSVVIAVHTHTRSLSLALSLSLLWLLVLYAEYSLFDSTWCGAECGTGEDYGNGSGTETWSGNAICGCDAGIGNESGSANASGGDLFASEQQNCVYVQCGR